MRAPMCAPSWWTVIVRVSCAVMPLTILGSRQRDLPCTQENKSVPQSGPLICTGEIKPRCPGLLHHVGRAITSLTLVETDVTLCAVSQAAFLTSRRHVDLRRHASAFCRAFR
ncbi:putative leader peptide [Lentzea sp. NPDC005914]|uniref:putative leader peptide n=1 Tax=Lentzea sp. NPDC005914 TaxID=3154572 RepID=UPI0033E1E4D5